MKAKLCPHFYSVFAKNTVMFPQFLSPQIGSVRPAESAS